ncbi:MAG TPA: PKD domain-containing protein [Steroidobacteraceae bacterium]|nr:PKD domain-containing protein [Steroidobacteraceae bacterium]
MKKSALVLLSAVFSALLLCACGGHASDDSVPPRPNVAPYANAGTDQSVIGGSTVTLDGSASADTDGAVVSYAWTQTAGPAVTLATTNTATTAFTAPGVATPTPLTFSLVVTDNMGAASAADTVTVTVNPPTAGTITGAVRFMRIPTSDNGLDYAGQQFASARGVVVQAVNATTDVVISSGETSFNGTYVLQVPASQPVRVIVYAQMSRQAPQALPHWNFQVIDAQSGDATYSHDDGVVLDTSAPVTHDIDIASGYDSAGTPTGTRDSAPFAILDTVYKARQLVLGVQPTADFPALNLDWSVLNPGSNTYFQDDTIVISGDATEDTDEFDEHVLAHEFGHYIEANFSRGDSLGGPHALGDELDIRVAFSEGFGYAFAAMVLNDPVMRDTYVGTGNVCPNNQCTFAFNVEDNPAELPAQAVPAGNVACYCSESTVWSLLWDVYDSAADGPDNVALGFGPMWTVLTNEQRTAHAFTSLFTFMSALKNRNPASGNALSTLIDSQNTNGGAIEPYASNETYFPPPSTSGGILPIYANITVGGGPVVVSVVDDHGTENKLGNARFLKFTLQQPTTITISASSTGGDADFFVYRDGAFVDEGFSFDNPEQITMTSAPAGDYVIEVNEYSNITGNGTGDFDITVQVQ